ncbi:MAG: MMPL family transporter [Alphaproteobacteria bacterium]|nr:MMPL family transporter [Alphaproteobacteria bacterium]
MYDRAERLIAALLTRWVGLVIRFPWPVVVLCLATTIGCAVYTANNFGVNTDPTDMISEELPFRQNHKIYREAFDQFSNPITVVIDGATPDLADLAASRLAARLEADTTNFVAVDQAGGDPFFARNGLLYLDEEELYDLGDRLTAAQPLLAELTTDMSLRGLFDILTEAADRIVDGDVESADGLGPIMDELTTAIDGKLDGDTVYFSWQDVMSGKTEKTSDRRRFILVEPVQDFGQLRPASAAIREVRRLAQDLDLTAEHGVTVRLTGSTVLGDEELKGISKDAALAGMISFVLVGLILFGGLRSPKIALASLITIFVGLVWTAAFAVVAVGDFNMISIAFAVLFIGLSVDFNIHFGLRYREGLVEERAPSAALVKTAGDVGTAVTVGAVTTAIAFYAFIPTDYTGVSELGVISGSGMIIALFATMTLLPALLAIMPTRPSTAERSAPRGEGLNRTLVRFSGPILIVALILFAGAVIESTRVRFDFDPINLRDPNTESVQTFRDLQMESASSTYTIKVLEPDLETAEKLVGPLETLPTVKDVVTLASFVPRDQDEKLDIIDGIYLALLPVLSPQIAPKSAPTATEQITAAADLRTALEGLAGSGEAGDLAAPAQHLATALGRLVQRAEATPTVITDLDATILATLPSQLDRLRDSMRAAPVTSDDLPDSIRDAYLAADGRARIQIFPTANAAEPEALEEFVREVLVVAPNATGGPVLIVESGKAVIDAFILASVVATILICCLLLVLLRSLADTVLVLMPLVLAGFLTLGTAALLDMPFNFANVIVLPLLLGLTVDGGIHMVMRRKGLNVGQALMQTSTPRAVGLSALTTICSFGSLAISSHQGTASMGKLLTISLTYTLIATLIVLPALLALRERLRSRAVSA